MSEAANPDPSPSDVFPLILAAALFGAVGLFGKLVELSPGALSFGRAVFASLALIIALRLAGPQTKLDRRDWGWTMLGAIGQAGNWALFFASIQAAGMSVAVLSLFTYPTLTALAEPLFTRQRPKPLELAGAGLVLAGVLLVTPEMNFGNQTTLGVAYGVASAALLTLRNIVARFSVAKIGAVRLNLYNCLAAIPLFLPFWWIDPTPISWKEVGWLALLGVAFTAVPQVLFFHSLRRVTAAWASLVVSLQPVFALIFAAILMGERPEPRSLAGGLLILAAVVLVSLGPQFLTRPEPLNESPE